MINTNEAVPSASIEQTQWQKWRSSLFWYIFALPVWAISGGVLFFVPALLGVVEACIAIPYIIFATIYVLRTRSAARKQLESDSDLSIILEGLEFNSKAQKSSFLVHCVILALGPLALVLFLLKSLAIIIALIVLAIYGILAIITNWNWIYDKQLVLAEEYALSEKEGSWKLIRLNRIMAWVIWVSILVLLGVIYYNYAFFQVSMN